MTDSCAYCGRSFRSANLPRQRDHVVPSSRRGPDIPQNIVDACCECNAMKSDRTPTEWLGSKAPARVVAIERQIKSLYEITERKPYQKIVASRHLGLRLTGPERILLDALVYKNQQENPLSRITISSLMKDLVIQAAKDRGFEVFYDTDGKLGLRRGDQIVPVHLNPLKI